MNTTTRRKSSIRPSCAASRFATAMLLAGGMPLFTRAQPAPEADASRDVRVEDIAVPPGFKIEPWVRGLSYAVDITFDDQGNAYVAEAGGHTYGTSPEEAPPARIIKFSPDGSRREVIVGETGLSRWTSSGGTGPRKPCPRGSSCRSPA